MVQEYCGTGNNNAAIKKQPVNLNMLMQKNGQNRKKKKKFTGTLWRYLYIGFWLPILELEHFGCFFWGGKKSP